jgi:hypothetical protein
VLAEGYGDTPEQIAGAVIAEWLKPGADDPDVSAVWFATPEIYEAPEGWEPEPPPATLDEARHKFHHWMVAQWQDYLVGQLRNYPVGFWQIIQDSRYDFRLVGDNLTECARLGMLALLWAGAKPIERVPDPPLTWRIVKRYGETPEQIADAVLTEWIAAGRGNPGEDAVWFGTANTYAPNPSEAQWLDSIVAYLPKGPIGFLQIMRVSGYGFHFTDKDLTACVRLAMLAPAAGLRQADHERP